MNDSEHHKLAQFYKSKIVVITSICAAMLLLVLLNNIFAPLIGNVGFHIRHVLMFPLLNVGKHSFTSLSIIKIALYIGLIGLVAHFAMYTLQKRLLIHTRLTAGQQYAIARILSYIIFVVGSVLGLESLGLNLRSLLVLGGALGLGVGLGLQPVISNFMAGLILLLEQPIRLGDRIEIEETYGTVIALKGRSTWIRTNDNVMIIVPNSAFIEKSVTNWTANDRSVRIIIPVGVGYNSDPNLVRQTLEAVARANPDVLTEPEPDVVFEDFGDSCLNFKLRVWTENKVYDPSLLKSALNYAIYTNFRRLGIEIPFPQRDVHITLPDGEAPVWAVRHKESRRG